MSPRHDWRRVRLGSRLRWGYLAPTGPGEESYFASDGTIDGAAYECATCGCVRLFAWIDLPTPEGETRRENVALHGFDWESLAPMRAVRCEVLTWPGAAVSEAAA